MRIVVFILLTVIPGYGFIDEPTWKKCKNTKVYSTSNAGEVMTFDRADPETLVIYFFASRLRADKTWKAVLPADYANSPGLAMSLKEYDSWKFIKFNLVESQMLSEREMYIKVFFEIRYKGKVDKGTDEVTLAKMDGEWFIVDLPT